MEVARLRQRSEDRTQGAKVHLSSLSVEDEAIIVAFRKHTVLPLDDCLYAFQATIPHLTRSSLHRCLQRHSISQLPDVEDGKGIKRKFKTYPIGYFHIDIAEVRTAEGQLYLLVATDRTSKFAYTELHEKATRRVAADFLRNLIKAVPIRFTPSSRTMALTSPIRPATVGPRLTSRRKSSGRSSSGPMLSSWPAPATISIIASPSPSIPGPMGRSSA